MNRRKLYECLNSQVVFREEPALPETGQPPWRILVVDDDPEVHQATGFALAHLQVADRPLELLHAYSSAEALRLLAVEPDIAVVLLDVVMETPTAGLDIIARIRDELGLACTRIILRTGQPGYAPEIDTIRRYDINDYKAKSELTQTKLFAALSVALRTYAQICQAMQARESLQKIIDSGRRIKSYAGEDRIPDATDLLLMLAAYFGAPPDGFLVARALGLGVGPGAGFGHRAARRVGSSRLGAGLDLRLCHGRLLGFLAGGIDRSAFLGLAFAALLLFAQGLQLLFHSRVRSNIGIGASP